MESSVKTILIVEDEVDIQNLMIRILSVRGYNSYLVASNGKEALDILKHQRPALIITDRMMPVMDGLEMLNLIKSDRQTSQIPIIVISAIHPPPQREAEGLWNDYIVKPLTIQKLLESVHKLIGAP